jgi:acetyl esterase/lipase
MRPVSVVVALLALVLTLSRPMVTAAQEATPAPAAEPPGQPLQPATGPGGAEFAYDGIRAQHFGPWPIEEQGGTGFWLFEPLVPHDTGTPVADVGLPLVIFLHAFTITDPEWYHVWIDHLARRGAIVVFPDYEPEFGSVMADLEQTDYGQTVGDTEAAIRAAVEELGTDEHARADLSRVAVVGASFGALLGADYAADAAAQDLPEPRALLLANPGCAVLNETACQALGDLSAMPATTRVLVLTGTDDAIGSDDAKLVWERLSAVPSGNKDFVTLVSDAHGQPPMVADHFVTLTSGFALGYVDALDWYGPWKLFDGLMSCSFADQDCDVALGNTPQQRFMGTWSDGVPVAEAQVTDDPGPGATLDATPAA